MTFNFITISKSQKRTLSMIENNSKLMQEEKWIFELLIEIEDAKYSLDYQIEFYLSFRFINIYSKLQGSSFIIILQKLYNMFWQRNWIIIIICRSSMKSN